MSQNSTGDMTRIQIDNIEDWSHIHKNFTEAIMTSLSRIDPVSGNREAVKAHLLQWRDHTFQLAKLNVRVNGRNFEDYSEDQEDTEPFNEVLDRRIWSLNAERMIWDKELGDRRRKIPLEMERLVEDVLKNEAPPLNEEIPDIDMQEDDYKETTAGELFGETAEIIENLDEKAPKILERTNRARRIAEEIRNLPT